MKVIKLYDERLGQMMYSKEVACDYEEASNIQLLFDNLYFYIYQSGAENISKRFLLDQCFFEVHG